MLDKRMKSISFISKQKWLITLFNGKRRKSSGIACRSTRLYVDLLKALCIMRSDKQISSPRLSLKMQIAYLILRKFPNQHKCKVGILPWKQLTKVPKVWENSRKRGGLVVNFQRWRNHAWGQILEFSLSISGDVLLKDFYQDMERGKHQQNMARR